MIKSKLVFVLSVALLVVLLMPMASAHETEISHEESDEATSTATLAGDEVTLEDLELEDTGLLPTNPLYFIKEWGRGIRSALAFDPVKKTELELRVANEKAAELKKVAENNPQDDAALERAIENYNKNVERLRTRLEALKENSENPKVDKLLDELTDRALKHEQIFEELKVKRQALRERLEQSQNNLDDTVAQVPEKLDNPDKFRERLEKVLKNQKETELRELKTLHFLSRLEAKASSTEVKEKISRLKEDEGEKFEQKIERLKDETKEKKDIKAGDAARMIDKAKEAIRELEIQLDKIKAGDSLLEKSRLNSVKVLLERAKNQLSEAERLYKEERYGAAYGQANSARLTARNALGQLLRRIEKIDKPEVKAPVSATSTKATQEERKKETVDEKLKKERSKIEQIKRNIKETKSKLPATTTETE